MKQPLRSGLQAIISQNRRRFHMPGHKGRRDFLLPLEWDFTEIPESDDLHDPVGILKRSQEEAAQLFGAKESYYLVNGASGGLQAAILSVCAPEDRVVIPRNAHQSIHFGIEFAGATPVYLLPKEESDGVYAGLNLKEFQETVERENPRAAVFVYPTYEGVCWGIEPFLAFCREKGVIAIIDEAHGAHLPFFEELPPSTVTMGADLVVQSVHKMLPAPTQTAILHRCSNRVPSEWVREALHRTQSSSPSYLLLLGMEEALAWMDNRESGCAREPGCEIQRVWAYRERVLSVQGIELFERTRQDPYKLLIRGNQRGLSGSELFSCLRAAGVEPEWQQGDWVLCMAAPYQAAADWEHLIDALQNLPTGSAVRVEPVPAIYHTLPERACSTMEARKALRRKVAVAESVGCIAAETLTPYPPGIPVVMAGERVSQEIADTLQQLLQENRTIYGGDHQISVILE